MKTWIRILIGTLLIGVLLYLADWKGTLKQFEKVEIAPVAIAFLLLNANIFISSLKWKILLHAKSIAISWWLLARSYWIGTFFGNYLPTSVGGDIVRLIMFNNIGRTASMAASIAWERITGLCVLLGLSLAVLIVRPQYFQVGKIWLFLWLLVFAGIATIGALITMGDKLIAVVNKISLKPGGFAGKLVQKLGKFVNAIHEYRNEKKAIFISLLLSVPFYFAGILLNYMLFGAIDAKVEFVDVMCILPIVYLVSLLPISLNGLGLSEGAFVVFFGQIGVPAHQALAVAIIRRLIHLMVSLVGGLLWLLSKNTVNLKRGGTGNIQQATGVDKHPE